MCGFVGIWHASPDRPVERGLLKAMTDTIIHRGPDDEGFFVDRNLGLGFRRLSIIDLSAAGHQPMCNEDGSVWIVFNGEYYGFQHVQQTLRARGHQFKSRTDTETILHLYEEEGIEGLAKIDGMFAFALWDGRKRELYLVRDRLGIKPLFYYTDGNRVVFGSEMKAILRDPSVPREIDNEALSHYLSFMTIPAPFTAYRNMYKLRPGHYLKITADGIADVCYWDLPSTVNEEASEESLAASLDELLGEAVRSQLVSDVPLGAFLSGGVDSSIVVAKMADGMREPVRSFSIAFPGMGDDDETPFARQVSTLLKTDHREFAVTPHLIEILPKLVWHFDEPFAVSSAFATYFLARMARENVTVALTGDGGDEVFAGYPFRYSQDARFQRIAWIPQPFRRLLFGAVEQMPVAGPAAMKEFLQWAKKGAGFFTHDADYAFFRTLSFFTETHKRLLVSDKDRFAQCRPSFDILDEHYRRRAGQDPVSRRLYADIKTTLADEMLTKVDRMTMASSLEARVPLLDHRVVEFAARVPARYKLHGREGKLVLKRSAAGYLPSEILHRRKHGFNVPLDKWLRGELFPFMTDLLSEETLKRRGIFDARSVGRLIADHREHRANNVGQLYILMNFELWQRQFLDAPAAGGTA